MPNRKWRIKLFRKHCKTADYELPAVCRYYRDFSKTGLNLLLPYIIRRIMEIQIAVFGFINRNKCL